MSNVTELGYVGFGVSNINAWKKYATEVMGVEWFEEAGTTYLRNDLWHHRIALHQDASDDLLYIGWRVADAEALQAMGAKLKAAGISFAVGSDAEASARFVLGLIKLTSPGGIPTEVFWGPRVDAHKPFHPGRPLFGRFKTGEHLLHRGKARSLHRLRLSHRRDGAGVRNMRRKGQLLFLRDANHHHAHRI